MTSAREATKIPSLPPTVVEHDNNPEGLTDETHFEAKRAENDPQWRHVLVTIHARLVSSVPWAQNNIAKPAVQSLSKVPTNKVQTSQWAFNENGSNPTLTEGSQPMSPVFHRDISPHTKHDHH